MSTAREVLLYLLRSDLRLFKAPGNPSEATMLRLSAAALIRAQNACYNNVDEEPELAEVMDTITSLHRAHEERADLLDRGSRMFSAWATDLKLLEE